MKKAINPAKLICGLLGLCTIVSIGGAISSTLAWYAYATRAALLFSGTSVYDNGQLQIGVKSDDQITALSDNGMIEEQIGSSYYYFAPAGEGLNSERINIYLAARGYATNELIPVTSGEYFTGNSLSLKQSPTTDNHNNSEAATMGHYSHITFAFRAFHTDANGDREFVAGQELWLTHAQTRASVSSSGKVSQAMRMYVSRDVNNYGANNSFILNPSSKNAGETKVAGLLNLGHDKYYDFDENGEIVYGDYVVTDGQDSGIINNHYGGEDVLADVNGSGSTTADTFTAKHSPNAPAYYENLNKLTIKTAQFEGIDTIKPNKAADGTLSNPIVGGVEKKTSVCITGGESVGYIGEFDATIYIEGWDFSVIDEEHRHKFDFQLRFETNRI